MSSEKIHIIGISDEGLEGLTENARSLLDQAELLIGSEQALAAATGLPGERLEIGGKLESVVQRIQDHHGQRTVVLAIGDPLFFGTARYLCDRLGKRTVRSHAARQQHAIGVCPRQGKLG